MKRSPIAAALALAVLSLLAAPAQARPRHHHRHHAHHDHHRPVASVNSGLFSFFAGGDLVSRARLYLGTNPTGWSHVWCGRFMAMVAPNAAARLRNPNTARDWAALPRTSPHVGAIAVLSRGRRGGHVGVVSGFSSRGDPIIVSGNHGRLVGEGTYPLSRVIAFVSAD